MIINEATIAYVLNQFGVESRPVKSIGNVVLMLPMRTQAVDLGNVITAEQVVDRIQDGRDRLFSATLRYMAEHDDDIRAVLDRIAKAAERRAEIVDVVKGLLR